MCANDQAFSGMRRAFDFVGKKKRMSSLLLADGFLKTYWSSATIESSTKWKTRHKVVSWLASSVSVHHVHQKNKKAQSSRLQRLERRGSTNLQRKSPDQMNQVPPLPEDENFDIIWSGHSSVCPKNLNHYESFSRNGSTISVYSFVFILAGEEGGHHLGYLEDMYEDHRERKMVKVRWFHRSEEVIDIIPEAQPHELLITHDYQVLSAECIDGLATILTPEHYNQSLDFVTQDYSDGIFMCSKQIKNNKVSPFPLSNLRGYKTQIIFSVLNPPDAPDVVIQPIPLFKEKERESKGVVNISETQPVVGSMAPPRSRVPSFREKEQEPKRVVTFSEIQPVDVSPPSFRVPPSREKEQVSKGVIAISETKPVDVSLPCSRVSSFTIGDEIELLSQDSGMRGCWFRCKILKVSKKALKVEHMDVKNEDGSRKLKEWVDAYRMAGFDKLGMRWLGRKSIRPFPKKESSDDFFTVGSAVDAWWCDGWWEGVVVGTDVNEENNFYVYFPGEKRFEYIEKMNLRSSKDWVDSKWVEINPKPDIVSFLSSNLKLQRLSSLGEPSGSESGPASATEAPEKEGKRLIVLGLVAANNVVMMRKKKKKA